MPGSAARSWRRGRSAMDRRLLGAVAGGMLAAFFAGRCSRPPVAKTDAVADTSQRHTTAAQASEVSTAKANDKATKVKTKTKNRRPDGNKIERYRVVTVGEKSAESTKPAQATAEKTSLATTH